MQCLAFSYIVEHKLVHLVPSYTTFFDVLATLSWIVELVYVLV